MPADVDNLSFTISSKTSTNQYLFRRRVFFRVMILNSLPRPSDALRGLSNKCINFMSNLLGDNFLFFATIPSRPASEISWSVLDLKEAGPCEATSMGVFHSDGPPASSEILDCLLFSRLVSGLPVNSEDLTSASVANSV